ncbi:hypothetical protein MHB54_15825 [Paenibacillus sp. FSL M7-0802]|uniref:hypothetical protein n=1 Tax=Paenibacillus polymyxa TaxID=1406 RepID=UPI0003D34490|nr:hypothetical protein [Paenibacillus polymyxa]AIW41938.1 hypothetical protein X809_39460 [Paenibacillus polymyxa CR1]
MADSFLADLIGDFIHQFHQLFVKPPSSPTEETYDRPTSPRSACETLYINTYGVIFETSEKLYHFAPIALKHGIVHNEYESSSDGSQGLDSLHRITVKRSQKAKPSKAAMIHKPIYGILALKVFTFCTFTKPVLLMKSRTKSSWNNCEQA